MTAQTNTSNSTMRLVLIGALVIGAFFGAYKIASAVSGRQSAGSGTVGAQGAPASGAAAAGTPACACCGSSQPTANGVSGAEAAGTAAAAGGVQKISVDVSGGTYSPNVLKLKAGVPAEITFGQSSGCTAVVQSQDLGFQEDLTSGPKTVKLGALKPGTYAFSCGMQMVFGKIVVE
jgi:plastocyanin